MLGVRVPRAARGGAGQFAGLEDRADRSRDPTQDPVELYSIGHSTDSLEAFLGRLAVHEIEAIADIRAWPTSRRFPHFGREALSGSLAASGVVYRWLPALGGRRHTGRADSPHRAWSVAGFRNYADHMESVEFDEGLASLLALASARRTAFLCAERLWWRCHRRLLADKLLALGHGVTHIIDAGSARPHAHPPFLRIVDGRLLYDRV